MGHLRKHISVASIGSNPVPVTRFTDSFLRADQPPFIGLNWAYNPQSDSNIAPLDAAGALVTSVANGLVVGSATNLNAARMTFIPNTIDIVGTQAQSLVSGLFARATIKSRTAGTDCQTGPAVFCNYGSANCYFIEIQSAGAGTIRVARNVGAGNIRLVDPVGAFNIGDVWEIRVTLASAANTILTFQNGSLVNTFVDNTGGRLPVAGGLPGLSWDGSFGGLIGLQDYAGGTL